MRASIFAFTLLAGCAITTLATKSRSWPDLDGEAVAGVARPTTIHRDEYGVPHIRAADAVDAIYALGWVTAEDRLFQADLTRRLAWGTVGDVFGPEAAEYDVFAKAMGLHERAEQALLEHATPQMRAMVVAYAEGINDGVASLGTLPVEYRLLGVEWEPWTAVDALAATYTMSWFLADNTAYELVSLALRDLEPDTLDALLRLHPDDPPIDAYWDELRKVEIGELTGPFLAFTGFVGGRPSQAEASNNWVIGPSRSADGLPILANDPHLYQRVPSVWYVVDVEGGDLHAAGVSLPGSPGVVLGHNGRVAWGATNTMADVVDLAVLERKGEDGYILAGEEKKLECDHELVCMTELGPVITELTEGATHLVAMRWHALEVEDETLGAYWGLARAGSVEEALEAFDKPQITSQNLMIADTEGNIAWQVTGSLVRRKNFTGRVPYPASDPQYGWQGWLDRAPGEVNPARGFVSSANSRPDHPLASAISTSYVPPHRKGRVDMLLSERSDWTPDDVRAMQLDAYDLHAVSLLDALLPGVEPSTDASRQCYGILTEWDRVADRDSVGATAFAYFQIALLREALVDDIGEDAFRWALAINSSGRTLLQSDYQQFLQDPAASADAALGAACTRMVAERGEDPSGWAWGAVHPLALQHPFAARVKALSAWNMPSVPWYGTGSTLMAGGYSWSKKDWRVGSMQSMRLVMPLSDLGKSTVTYPGGQSGQPGSPLYASYYDAFVAGEGVPLRFRDEDVAASTVHTLTLVPGAPRSVAGRTGGAGAP